MKILKKIAWGLLILFIAIQFYRPEKNSVEGNYVAVFELETNPPQEVKTLLRENCYDCHSNHTNYPWYNNIAPVSFWLEDHIKHGKGELNFSDWENYSAKKKDHKLDELIEEVDAGEMPIKEYTWTHGNLTSEEQEALMTWANNVRVLYRLGPPPN